MFQILLRRAAAGLVTVAVISGTPAWAGRTPDPPPGQVIPLSYVYDRFEKVVEDLATQHAGILARACHFDARFPRENKNMEWLDLVARKLHRLDSRWGYNWKRGEEGNPSADVLVYHYDQGGSESTRDFDDEHVYGIDLIGDCGGANNGQFADITDKLWFKWARHKLPHFPPVGDYDGDGRTDFAVFRPSNSTWYVQPAVGVGGFSRAWGTSGDVPAPGDYDGDGRTDLAVYRPSTGTWYALKSGSNWTASFTARWGTSTDIPVPGEYDGDGITDPAVFRPSDGTWHVLLSSTGYASRWSARWGASGDRPVPADYDGDGRADFALYRPANGTWFVLTSRSGYASAITRRWGAAGDIPQVGDADGDGVADMRVYRPSGAHWYTLLSSTGFTGSAYVLWGGMPEDRPVAADYTADGIDEIAVFRNGVWFVRSVATVHWGTTGDIIVSK
jgi:hypothetical protein